MIDKHWLFIADWLNPVFIHFAMDPRRLQPIVPFELDCFDGWAYVSLVAFTQSRLRPIGGGRIGQWLSAPLASHEFLNLRTYVRVNGQPAIHFIAEWIPNRLAVMLGPAMYGLPYRLGRLRYQADSIRGVVRGIVQAGAVQLSYRGTFDPHCPFYFAQPESLEHFLVERYAAYMSHNGIARRFNVSHAPWPLAPLDLRICHDSLLKKHFPLLAGARPIAAHVSPGVCDVRISPPLRQAWMHRVQYVNENGAAADVQSPCRSRRAETIRPGPGAIQQ